MLVVSVRRSGNVDAALIVSRLLPRQHRPMQVLGAQRVRSTMNKFAAHLSRQSATFWTRGKSSRRATIVA